MLIDNAAKEHMNVHLSQIDPKNQILNNLFIALQNAEEFPSDNQLIIAPQE